MDRPEAITPTIFILFFSAFSPSCTVSFSRYPPQLLLFQYFFHMVSSPKKVNKTSPHYCTTNISIDIYSQVYTDLLNAP